jgi:hypothetical protein
MRELINPHIQGISDNQERITFEKNFYATIDGIVNSRGIAERLAL